MLGWSWRHSGQGVVSRSDYANYKLEHLTASVRPQSSLSFCKATSNVTVLSGPGPALQVSGGSAHHLFSQGLQQVKWVSSLLLTPNNLCSCLEQYGEEDSEALTGIRREEWGDLFVLAAMREGRIPAYTQKICHSLIRKQKKYFFQDSFSLSLMIWNHF